MNFSISGIELINGVDLRDCNIMNVDSLRIKNQNANVRKIMIKANQLN